MTCGEELAAAKTSRKTREEDGPLFQRLADGVGHVLVLR
jgi:hypothetical protein